MSEGDTEGSLGTTQEFVQAVPGNEFLLRVGDRTDRDEVDYSDIDMVIRWVDGEERFLHKDGTAY